MIAIVAIALASPPQPPNMRHALLLVIPALLVCNTGCGNRDGRVKVYPVQGRVLVSGTPAEGAQVTFYPVSEELRKPGMPVPYGTTDSSGSFRLRSYDPADGAPLGDYEVTVFWPGPAPPNADPDSESYEPKDRLAGRYLDPKKSGLKAQVERGGETLPAFELE